MIIKLNFSIVCECPEEEAQDLGEDLAAFLQESWFNGEDVLEVGDLAEISVLANERWIVTDRVDQQVEDDVTDLESILGGY